MADARQRAHDQSVHVLLLCMLESFCKIQDSKVHDSTIAASLECHAPAKEVVLVDRLVHKLQQSVLCHCVARITAVLML